MASSDVDHWQCDKTLPQCMEYMLDNKLLSDVTFLVGEEREDVHAHKFVLASRSPVFYAMLNGPLAEKGKIEIPDVDKEAFLIFLRYLYTDKMSLQPKNVLDVMYAAKKYCVDLLTKHCSDFLKHNITPESACAILDAALRFSDEGVVQSCLKLITRNPKDCIKGESFAYLSKEALKSILKIDEMCIEEEVLYEEVMRWSEAECRRQNIEFSFEHKRQVLGDALYELRFPLMNPEYFAEKVGKTNLLSLEEKVEVLMFNTLKERAPAKIFKDTKRLGFRKTVERVVRLKECSRSWGLGGKIDAITFQTSHDSYLHGIAVYGCASSSCDYTIDVAIKDSSCITLITHSARVHSDIEKDMIDVRFDNCLKVEANKRYTIELKMVGLPSRKGFSGQTSVKYGNNKTCTFSNSPSCTNSTSVSYGQIPALLLSS